MRRPQIFEAPLWRLSSLRLGDVRKAKAAGCRVAKRLRYQGGRSVEYRMPHI